MRKSREKSVYVYEFIEVLSGKILCLEEENTFHGKYLKTLIK